MSELKPDVRQMLEVGSSCGLTTLGEAHGNYMMHYDMFFRMDKYVEQSTEFRNLLIDMGLATMYLDDDSKASSWTVDEKISIDDALKIVEEYYES